MIDNAVTKVNTTQCSFSKRTSVQSIRENADVIKKQCFNYMPQVDTVNAPHDGLMETSSGA